MTAMPMLLRRASLIVLFAAALSACGAPPPPAPASEDQPPAPASEDGPPAASPAWVVTPYGIGPLEVGMTIAEADAAVDGGFQAESGGCTYAVWPGAPAGVSAMVENGRVVRIDVESGDVDAEGGIGIGERADRVISMYEGRITIGPHKYTDGHYLTVDPGPSDTEHLIVFETDGERVVRYRAGERPAVEYVERCG